MAPTTKPTGQDKSNRKGKVDRKSKKGTSEGELEEHVRALGGDDSDLELLKGARDEQLVQGAGDDDVRY